MTHPLITIGITCHNAENTITSAIQSALDQTWDNTEVIIVDDASTDSSVQTIASLKAPVTLIQHATNKGVAAARNTIINAANGDYIAFFDDDDISTPERLQKQHDRLTNYQAQNAPVICHTARTQIYPDGTQRYEPTMGTNTDIAPNGNAVIARILTGKTSPNIFGSTATCSQMAKTSVYKELNGFDENFRRSEDTDFNIRAALTGAHFPGIAEALVTQTMTHASDKKLKDEYACHRQLLEKHQAAITSYDFCLQWLDAKYDFLNGHKNTFIKKLIKLAFRHPILTLQKITWALPNIGFNMRQNKFHNDQT